MVGILCTWFQNPAHVQLSLKMQSQRTISWAFFLCQGLCYPVFRHPFSNYDTLGISMIYYAFWMSSFIKIKNRTVSKGEYNVYKSLTIISHTIYSFSLFVDQTVSFLHHYIHVIYCSYKNYNLATNTVFPWILIATPQIFIHLSLSSFIASLSSWIEVYSIKSRTRTWQWSTSLTPVDFNFFLLLASGFCSFTNHLGHLISTSKEFKQ